MINRPYTKFDDSSEAAELLEHFQWRRNEEALDSATRNKVAEEMADVLLYLIRLADKLDIDLLGAADRKMKANARKYPVEASRGSSKKYTEL